MKFLLPVDHVVADKVDADARIQHIGEGKPIPADMMALDIGPKTVELFSAEIGTARTIVWNGPMGVFEIEAFAKGTKKIADAVADNGAAVSIVGGGDSVAAVKARAWPTRSRTSPPAAARRWSFWKARSCPAWKR